MKICVTAQGESLGSLVDSRFGRAKYFLIVDLNSLEIDSIVNPNIDGMGGVGVQSAQMIADKGVKVVLTGNVGPNAFATLTAAKISVITGISGIVKDAVIDYKSGKYQAGNGPSVDSKHGA